MKKQTLLLSLIIVALLTGTIQCIKLGKNHKTTSKHLSIFQQINHLAKIQFHNQDQKSQTTDDLLVQELFTFIKNDPQLYNVMMKLEDLKPEQAKKITGYILNSHTFNVAILNSFMEENSIPQCFKDFTQIQKEAYVSDMILTKDLTHLFNGDMHWRSVDEIDKAIQLVKSDPVLGPEAAECVKYHIMLTKVF